MEGLRGDGERRSDGVQCDTDDSETLNLNITKIAGPLFRSFRSSTLLGHNLLGKATSTSEKNLFRK